MRVNIKSRLKALLAKEEKLEGVATISAVAQVEGLQAHEIAALVSVAQEIDAPEDRVSAYTVRQGMEAAGFTKLATTLALSSLIEKSMVEANREGDMNGNDYFLYCLTPVGVKWLFANQNTLPLRSDKTEPVREMREEDIPF